MKFDAIERAALWIADTMILARFRVADAVGWPWDDRLRKWAIRRNTRRWLRTRRSEQ